MPQLSPRGLNAPKNKDLAGPLNPYMVQQMLDPQKMAENMKEKLQVETKHAVSQLSEYALKNPNFNHKFVKIESETLIAELRVEQKIQERLRKRKAQIECLAMGWKIEQFDFNNEETLLKFG